MNDISDHGQNSEVLVRINALTDERGKVLRQGQFLSHDQRMSLIQDIDKERALLWARRRAELSAVEMRDDPALGSIPRQTITVPAK
jgi:hypothetical protein